MEIKYVVNDMTNEYTVSDVLKKELKLSRRLIIHLKNEKSIFLNDILAFTNKVVKKGDILKVEINEPKSSETIIPQEMELDILYEDEHIIAINKPRGIAVHPTFNFPCGTLANGVLNYYKGQNFVFRSVNRLDKDTSGIVLIAKNRLSAERLCSQLKKSTVDKVYVAITENVPPSESGTICCPILRDKNSTIKRCVSENGSYAETSYKLLEKSGKRALVEICPKTGRTHQIRVHMAHIGCPLYSDFLYGTEIEGETFYLHCTKVSFIHPFTQQKITIECKLPEYFKNPLI